MIKYSINIGINLAEIYADAGEFEDEG